MRLPSLREYQLAVQHPHIAFRNDSELASGTLRQDRWGMPKVASGGFATTFQVNTAHLRWAVRCFHKNAPGDRRLFDRYHCISEFIRDNPQLDFLVPVEYRPDGVLVHGMPFPTVRMGWVDGAPLGVWLADWARQPDLDPADIDAVRLSVAVAARMLRELGVAHGDLQHGNIIVRSDLSIRLIDYDGMYLPELAGLGPIEEGHRNYQHPERRNHYDATLDEFAAAGLDLALSACALRPDLLDRFGGTGENLLFQAADYANPDQSPVFAELLGIDAIAPAVRRFQDACRGGYGGIAAALRGAVGVAAAGPRSVDAGVVVRGEHGDELRELAGTVATVFGTVVSTKLLEGGAIALINLAPYQDAGFTIVCFDEVADELFRRYGRSGKYGEYLDLKGRRVAVEHVITLYEGRYSKKLTPQIILEHADFLQILDTEQFEELIDATDVWASWTPLTESPVGATESTADDHAQRGLPPPMWPTSPPAQSDSVDSLEHERQWARYSGLDARYRNRAFPPAQPTRPPAQPRHKGGQAQPESRPPPPAQAVIGLPLPGAGMPTGQRNGLRYFVFSAVVIVAVTVVFMLL
ncbi:hypothetical protein ACQP06_12910 [Nocardia sp. CA-136227]|uniref:hypothetical protein n=1 Tax=Nocardia sp. CA-136227 TaxID=3239979 RepID=UPI003D99FF12